MSKGDDILAVHFDVVVFGKELWQLVLRPFICCYRICDWAFDDRDGGSKSVIRGHRNKASCVKGCDVRRSQHGSAANNVTTSMEIMSFKSP